MRPTVRSYFLFKFTFLIDIQIVRKFSTYNCISLKYTLSSKCHILPSIEVVVVNNYLELAAIRPLLPSCKTKMPCPQITCDSWLAQKNRTNWTYSAWTTDPQVASDWHAKIGSSPLHAMIGYQTLPIARSWLCKKMSMHLSPSPVTSSTNPKD